MKFLSLSETDKWVTMQVLSSRESKQDVFLLYSKWCKLNSVQQLSYFDVVFFSF